MKKIPFLRLLLPLISGILLSGRIDIAAGAMVVATAVAVAVVFAVKDGRWRDGAITAAIFLAGITSVKALRPESTLPRGQRLVISCRITDNITTRGRWHRTVARVEAYRLYDDSLSVWRGCDDGISLFVDTAYEVSIGERVGAVAYINPLDSTGGKSGYAQTMLSRGVTGRAYVIDGRLIGHGTGGDLSLWDKILLASKKLQGMAGERLLSGVAASGGYDKEKGVALALLTGDKSLLDSDTRDEYSRAGTSHILAISGLHLGIIFALLNCLLMPLAFVRGGNVLKPAVIILFLWGYAFMTGLSPSVLRSAFMLSMLQLSLTTWRAYNPYNSLFASAFVLLLVNPLMLYDISFQMSYLALSGIFFFYKRFERWSGVLRVKILLKRAEDGRKGWRRLVVAVPGRIFTFAAGTVIIALAAQITVAPLTGYVFGRIPLLNLFVNPVVMTVVTVAMFAGFVCMALPGGVAGEWFYKLLKIQNAVTEKTAAFRFASVETPDFPQEALYLTYFLMLCIMVFIKWMENDRKRIFDT